MAFYDTGFPPGLNLFGSLLSRMDAEGHTFPHRMDILAELILMIEVSPELTFGISKIDLHMPPFPDQLPKFLGNREVIDLFKI
jgi:hypothetical protein